MRIKASTEVTLVVNAKGYSERHEEVAAALEEYVKGEDFLRDVVMPRLAEHVLIEHISDSTEHAEQVTVEVKPELPVPQPITPTPTSDELVALLPQEVLDICEELGFEIDAEYEFDDGDFKWSVELYEVVTYTFIHADVSERVRRFDMPYACHQIENRTLGKLSKADVVTAFDGMDGIEATRIDFILDCIFNAKKCPTTEDELCELIDACNAAKTYYSKVQELIKRVRALAE